MDDANMPVPAGDVGESATSRRLRQEYTELTPILYRYFSQCTAADSESSTSDVSRKFQNLASHLQGCISAMTFGALESILLTSLGGREVDPQAFEEDVFPFFIKLDFCGMYKCLYAFAASGEEGLGRIPPGELPTLERAGAIDAMFALLQLAFPRYLGAPAATLSKQFKRFETELAVFSANCEAFGSAAGTAGGRGVPAISS
jgi:hypothetical protein